MARPLKKGGSGGQLTLLLPITTKRIQRSRVIVNNNLKLQESRKRLLKDLERTGLRTATD